MPDPIFSDPRLAALYDSLDDDRSDLNFYADIVDELAASSVLDIGCGTGTLACRLAEAGIDVVGLDPAAASLDIARHKPGADRVRWIHGDATAAPPDSVDLVTMTGNVAQVFIADVEWSDALQAATSALHAGGWLVFETRDPAPRAWERWTKAHTYREVTIADVGLVTTWTELLDVHESLVSFRQIYRFGADGAELVSDSTLRFRHRDELAADLARNGLRVQSVRDAADRPGLELVFVAQRVPEESC